VFIGEAFIVLGKESLSWRPAIPDSHLGICSLRQDKFDLAPLDSGIALPYWLIVVLFAPLAAVPWLRLRFSLRTMLIATTLVSVVLCLAAFALRH
jgi:hypothetical protein